MSSSWQAYHGCHMWLESCSPAGCGNPAPPLLYIQAQPLLLHAPHCSHSATCSIPLCATTAARLQPPLTSRAPANASCTSSSCASSCTPVTSTTQPSTAAGGQGRCAAASEWHFLSVASLQPAAPACCPLAARGAQLTFGGAGARLVCWQRLKLATLQPVLQLHGLAEAAALRDGAGERRAGNGGHQRQRSLAGRQGRAATASATSSIPPHPSS